MMRSIALVFKASPKVIDNMVTGFVQAMVPKEVLKSKKIASSSGHKERMDEDFGNQVFPMNTNSVSLGTKQVGLSSAQSNHMSSQSTKQGQRNTLATLSVENQRNDNAVSPLSPTPSLEKLSCDSQMPVEAGNEIEATPSVVGFHMHTFEAHKPTSPKKPINNPSHTNKPTNTPSSPKKLINNPTLISELTSTSLSPKRRNLKRVAKAQGKGPQSTNLKDQSPTRLSSSKRAATYECLDENVNKHQKKQCESCPTEAQNKFERLVVTAEQHRREQ